MGEDNESVLADILRRLDAKDVEIQRLLERLVVQEQQIEQLQAGLEQKDHDLRLLQETYFEKTTGRLQRRDNEHNVAFYAEMYNFTIHSQAHNDLLFDNVVTNRGNAYNPYTGQFVAPVPGVYVFAVTMMSDPNHYSRYQIMKNGNQLLGNLLSHGSATTHDTSSQTVIVVLDTMDRVTVQHLDPDGFAHGHAYSSFAGFLQQQDYANQILG